MTYKSFSHNWLSIGSISIAPALPAAALGTSWDRLQHLQFHTSSHGFLSRFADGILAVPAAERQSLRKAASYLTSELREAVTNASWTSVDLLGQAKDGLPALAFDQAAEDFAGLIRSFKQSPTSSHNADVLISAAQFLMEGAAYFAALGVDRYNEVESLFGEISGSAVALADEYPQMGRVAKALSEITPLSAQKSLIAQLADDSTLSDKMIDGAISDYLSGGDEKLPALLKHIDDILAGPGFGNCIKRFVATAFYRGASFADEGRQLGRDAVRRVGQNLMLRDRSLTLRGEHGYLRLGNPACEDILLTYVSALMWRSACDNAGWVDPADVIPEYAEMIGRNPQLSASAMEAELAVTRAREKAALAGTELSDDAARQIYDEIFAAALPRELAHFGRQMHSYLERFREGIARDFPNVRPFAEQEAKRYKAAVSNIYSHSFALRSEITSVLASFGHERPHVQLDMSMQGDRYMIQSPDHPMAIVLYPDPDVSLPGAYLAVVADREEIAAMPIEATQELRSEWRTRKSAMNFVSPESFMTESETMAQHFTEVFGKPVRLNHVPHAAAPATRVAIPGVYSRYMGSALPRAPEPDADGDDAPGMRL